MCGITGFWQSKINFEHPLEVLSRMGAAIAHRGPDDSGEFFDDATGIGFAFRRLSILDLSPEGHQPMISASGRYVMVFNGEIFNYQEIRAECGAHAWRGHSDTEVMLQAFEQWGVESAIQRFVGMFAFALWDRQDRNLHLVRDRLGIKPLYYGRVGHAFVFASELKAICQHPEFDGEIDRNVISLYLRHNYVPSPHCIYKKLYKLPAGCMATLDAEMATPRIHRYWSAKEVACSGQRSPLQLSDSDAIEELHRLLLQAVKLRMIADVPLGAMLSGGLDSSTVVALMQAQSQNPVKTFTIGFHEDGFNEAADAKKVAEHLHTDHTELYLNSRDALDVIPLLPSMFDEPFSDASQIPTYLVSKLARRSVTVCLSGDGGDELFGGYLRYFLTRKIWNSSARFPRALRKASAFALMALPPDRIDSTFRGLRPFLPKTLVHATPGDKAHKLATLLSLDSPWALYYRALSHWHNPSDIVLQAHEPSTVRDAIQELSESFDLEETMMLSDMLYYLPDDILTKVDRASMAVSLEARVPLLDHRVVEFSWRLPRHLKIRNGSGKWILRQVLDKYVPRKLIERPKMGFGVPVASWLRGPLRDWSEDLLSERKLTSHGFFNPAPILQKWREHLSGDRNWQYLLWDVLVFQEWLSHRQLNLGVSDFRCERELRVAEAGLL
jgi:asparagine synthase (glutamine-hydrolysing)